MTSKKTRSGSGRPPKFQEPSSSVTITLPHRILQQLKDLDSDRAKAIVKCVESLMAMGPQNKKEIQIIRVSENTGLMVIGPCRSLARIPWLQLVEITPTRFLLSIPTGTAVASLEVAIIDLIETLDDEETGDKEMLMDLRQRLSQHRRREEMTTREIFIVNI